MTRHVFLIGFMGSGKSTVGRLLALELGRALIDLDAWIAQEADREIAEIFADDGEAGFRALESAVLRRAIDEGPSVIACGGGVVTSSENTDAMREAGTIVYLEMEEDDVFRRVRDDGRRPLLSDGPDAVAALFRQRRVLYEAAADLIVPTTSRTPGGVASEIAQAVGS